MELIEAPIFTRQIAALLRDEEYRGFQSRIAANPELGALISPRHLYCAVRKDVILLSYAYPKNVAADLTPKQISQLASAVKEEFGSEEKDL